MGSQGGCCHVTQDTDAQSLWGGEPGGTGWGPGALGHGQRLGLRMSVKLGSSS